MNQKRILKGMIIFILFIFLLSTGLVSVMYFADKGVTGDQTGTGENLTGSLSGTGANLSGSIFTGSDLTGKSVK